MNNTVDSEIAPSTAPTLLGHLATLHSLASQGELLCTQGLTFLVNQPAGNQAFRQLLERMFDLSLPPLLVWRAEERQSDKGRPDMEARAGEVKWVKVEAKLGARLDRMQVESFARDQTDVERHAVVLLVPEKRRVEVADSVMNWGTARVSDRAWRLADGGWLVALLTWEEVFEQLLGLKHWHAGGDLHQLMGLYHALNSAYVAPFAAADAWAATRDADRSQLIDRATRKHSADLGHDVMPMADEALADVDGGSTARTYNRRYVVKRVSGKAISLAVGVRTPFAGHTTRVWARFSYGTPGLDDIQSRLTRSGSPCHSSERHLWLPLEIPDDRHADAVVAALVGQLERIWAAAGI